MIAALTAIAIIDYIIKLIRQIHCQNAHEILNHPYLLTTNHHVNR
jgi:hypothetical protein